MPLKPLQMVCTDGIYYRGVIVTWAGCDLGLVGLLSTHTSHTSLRTEALADPDLSDSLNYTFLQGNELQLLLLDPATGELQLSRDLDNNRPLEALMEVSVSGEWPQGPRGAPPSPWGAAGGCQEPPGKPACFLIHCLGLS